MEAQVRNLIRDGKLREAASVCDELNQQFPDYGPGWYTTSKLALMVKEPLIGVQAIQRALELSPGQPEWLLQRIECIGKAGDLEVATSLAQQLANHVFDAPMHAAQFGKVLSYLGLFEDAKRQYQRACELNPDEIQHYFDLATVFHSLGEADAAQRALDRCLELNPDIRMRICYARACASLLMKIITSPHWKPRTHVLQIAQRTAPVYVTRSRRNWKILGITHAHLSVLPKGTLCAVRVWNMTCGRIWTRFMR